MKTTSKILIAGAIALNTIMDIGIGYSIKQSEMEEKCQKYHTILMQYDSGVKEERAYYKSMIQDLEAEIEKLTPKPIPKDCNQDIMAEAGC